MPYLYELALLGSPTASQIDEIQQLVSLTIEPFRLNLGHDVAWHVCPEEFKPPQQVASAAVFYGAADAPQGNLPYLLRNAIPVLPVASELTKVSDEIPEQLRPINCLGLKEHGTQRVASALLECAGLLPRQRRVFVSYRRDEARQAALQMFDELSARLFDVFLDTHGIAPAEDFQVNLWHRLCDSDVLVMLDTPNYFESRWTSAEYGRALAKGISILRIGWPDFKPSPRTSTACQYEISRDDINPDNGSIVDEAIERICMQLEQVRSQSFAVRKLNLVSNIQTAVEKIGGSVLGVGYKDAVHIELADGRDVTLYPTVGVPTSSNLHNASTNCPGHSSAVIYDAVGLHPDWLGHLDWLGEHIHTARWVKAHEAAWKFADWEA